MTSAAVPDIIGAEDDDGVCCRKLHELARSKMLEPMELLLEVVDIIEVAKDPSVLFFDLLFSLMTVFDVSRGGGGGICLPLPFIFSLGKSEFRGAIDKDVGFRGLFRLSPFFRRVLPVFSVPPSHMKSATFVANASAKEVVLLCRDPFAPLLVREFIMVGVSVSIIGCEYSLPLDEDSGR